MTVFEITVYREGWETVGIVCKMPSEAFQTAFVETGRLIRQVIAGAYADGADGDGFRPYLPLSQRHDFNLLHRPARKTLADGSEFQRTIADIKTVVGIVVVGIE